MTYQDDFTLPPELLEQATGHFSVRAFMPGHILRSLPPRGILPAHPLRYRTFVLFLLWLKGASPDFSTCIG